MIAYVVGQIILQMTLVQIQYFIEGIGPVKSQRRLCFNKALGFDLFRSKPSFITKGKFQLIAIVTNVFAVPYGIDDAFGVHLANTPHGVDNFDKLVLGL